MNKKLKSILALVLVGAALFALASCGATGAIEDFLTSDNYTFKSGEVTVKVNNASVYYSDGSVEKYLYYSKDEQSYFYCQIGSNGKISKRSIDSEQYILQHKTLVADVAALSEGLSAFLQLSDRLTEENGKYSFQGYTVEVLEGVISYKSGDYKATVSDVGATQVEIPEKILSAKTSII